MRATPIVLALACGPRVVEDDGGHALESGPAEGPATSGDAPECTHQDIEPPAPGVAGGLCLAPDGRCDEGITCQRENNYCYDADNPCVGFACGGADRGCCVVVDGRPSCQCDEGFDNVMFALYCCPNDGSDPQCP